MKKTIVGRTNLIPTPEHKIKIEHNIPIPPPETGRKRRWPFLEMKVGESIEVLEIEADRARAAAHNTATRHGFQFTTRRTGVGIRIWRVA